MLKKQYIKSRRICKVTFELPKGVGAKSAHLVGDFNDWDNAATPMEKKKDGRFSTVLEFEPGHEYRFRYLLDGSRWENDGEADRYEPNPFGGDNSVVSV